MPILSDEAIVARSAGASATPGQSVLRESAHGLPLMLYGVLSAIFGFGLYTLAMVWATVRFA